MLRSIYIETYGCQMNLADTEIINGILQKEGYTLAADIDGADAVFLNTCAVRDNAEQRIYGRLSNLGHLKKRNPHLVFGILGCMAERLRADLLEKNNDVDIVCGPDEYRKLPALIDQAFAGEKGIRTQLSRVETYDDIEPLRTEGVSAWVAVMRGCDKFCTFCVVPFTRGRERSRPLDGVVREVAGLLDRGFREVTLLGQNVNSYNDDGADFADLLTAVAALDRINWVESEGCYFHRYDVKEPRLAMRTTCSSLLPLMTGLVSKDRADRVFTEHALNPEEFWLEYLFPFNAKDEMENDKVYMEDLLLWRGHCIWTNMNWMMNEAFLAYDRIDEARELTRRTARMIQHEGFWEFYDFRNGQGKGQPDFNWPGLVLDMIARSWPEAAE